MYKGLYSILIFSFLIACSSSKQTVQEQSANLKELTEKDKVAFGEAFMDGVKAKILGNYAEAKTHFDAALKLQPLHPAANYELGLVLLQLEQQQLAAQQFKLAAELDPENYWYKLSYASFLDNKADKTEAIKIYKELIDLKPNQVELKYQLSRFLFDEGKPMESITYLNQIEEEIGVSEEIIKLKQSIYLSENDVEGAAGEVKKLIEANPGELKYHGQLADIYISNGKRDKALKVYQEMAERAPNDYRVQFSMAEFYRTEGEQSKYLEAITKAFNNPEMEIDSKVKYLLSFYQVNSKNQAKKAEGIALCEAIVKAHPNNAKSHALLADFLYFDEQTERAKEEYMTTISLDSSRFPVWNQLLVILSESGDIPALLNYGERAVNLFPNQPTVYLLYGLGLSQDKQYGKAIEYLDLGQDLVIDNQLLKGQIYSSMGDAYHAMEKHTESDAYYEKALKLDPNSVYVLNNYSYYLSLRKENLEKAKQMSLKSNQLAPGQASFQDTYAWILYQTGEYKDALDWINKALRSDGNKSAVLLEHKGDILFALDRKEEALEYWQKASEAEGEASEELLQKINKYSLP